MSKKRGCLLFLSLFLSLFLLVLLAPAAVHAEPIGGEVPKDGGPPPPPPPPPPPDDGGDDGGPVVELPSICPTGNCSRRGCSDEGYGFCSLTISRTEGNLSQNYSVAGIKSTNRTTLDLTLTYKSYNADGSHAVVETVLGRGWTHSYNIFLLSQRGHMFRIDENGRTTKYKLGPGGTFTPSPGYFETLVKNPDGSFTLTQKDKTVFQFALIPGTPFSGERPVYRLTKVIDRNNNTTTLTYTGGNLTTIIDTYGRSLVLGYNSQSKLATITDPLGRITILEYDSTGTRLIKITDPEGKSTQYSYNFLYQMNQKVDKDGRIFTYEYQNSKPVAIKDGAGDTIFRLSNPTNWVIDETVLARDLITQYIPSTTSKTDGRGNVWKYEYDKNGYVTKGIAPDNATTTFDYDPATLLLRKQTDANLHPTSYEYDTLGNRTKITDALGHVTTYTYEPVFNMMKSMTDPNSRVTTYDYDPRGNRIKETDPLGGMREWTYDSRDNVLTEKDKNGNVTRYEYDAFGNRIKTIDAVGNVTMMTYDAVGNLTSRTNARGFTTTYEYDGLNRLIREIDPFSNTTRTFYDGQGNRTTVVDRNGNATTYQYDLRQRLIKTIDALGQMTTQTYDGNDNRVSMTDKNAHTTTMQYDVQNRLIKTTDAIGNMSSMTYDGVGNKLTETDANNHTTIFEYDDVNRLVTKTDAVGCVTQMAYDSPGPCPGCTGPTKGSYLVTRQTDGNGKVTYFKYDGLDRLIIQIRKQTDTADVIDGDDAVTRSSYDAFGNRLTMTEPNGNTTSYLYDALNRQVKVTNAAGDMTLRTYDPVSNVKTVTKPNGNVTTNTYDALDRLTQVDDSEGRVANFTYDPVGNRLSERDGNGNGTDNTYDTIYRLTDVKDALGKTTHYDYDPVGNLLRLTDREGNLTTYVYDDINRRVSMTDALGNLTQYQYDGVGNLTKIIDANLHTTDYAYDKINRLIKETYADGRMRTFTYDCANNVLTRTDQKGQVTKYTYSDLYFLLTRTYPTSPADNLTYDLSGRMLTAERGEWLVTFAYDGANRVTKTMQNGKAITYVYDIPGRKRTVTYPGGRLITVHTDARSRLGSIDDASPNLVQYSYDTGNRVVSRVYRNHTGARYGYNANNWITSLNHVKADLTRIAGFTHDFDNEGNKRFEEKHPDAANSQTKSEAYQYDKIYRLIDFKVGTLVGSTVPVPSTQTHYDLDGVGNWNKKTKDGVPENRSHSVTNEITQINGVPVLSDLNGNTNEDGQFRYNYDEENRLIRVSRKSDQRVVGRYEYDALSRRIKKIANPGAVSSPVETRYFYDDTRIVEEQDTAGLTLATYVYGTYIDEILTMDRAGQAYYYHQNSLWSVEAITDSAANVVERYAYDAYGLPAIQNGSGMPTPANPWGTPHSVIGNPWMFTGRQLDEETGLYFYRARYYDPVKGRFLQRDALGYLSGVNLYAYVDGRPTAKLDPYGLKCVDPPGLNLDAVNTSPITSVFGAVRTFSNGFGIDYTYTRFHNRGSDNKKKTRNEGACCLCFDAASHRIEAWEGADVSSWLWNAFLVHVQMRFTRKCCSTDAKYTVAEACQNVDPISVDNEYFENGEFRFLNPVKGKSDRDILADIGSGASILSLVIQLIMLPGPP
jgi:RHS repeat-associated protein